MFNHKCSECGGHVRPITLKEAEEKELNNDCGICEKCGFTFGESMNDVLEECQGTKGICHCGKPAVYGTDYCELHQLP
jgi:hypothetical protein